MRRFLGVACCLGLWLLGTQPGFSSSAAREAGYLYLSPVPGAPYVSAQTRYILIRLKDTTPDQVTNLAQDFITVSGSASGKHTGLTRVASDGRTISFHLLADFNDNELVTVTLNPSLSAEATGHLVAFEYQFMVTGPMPGSNPGTALAAALPSPPPDELSPPVTVKTRLGSSATGEGKRKTAAIFPNGVSVPSDFPQVSITVNSNPSPGVLFLENGLGGVWPFTMLLDNNGSPVWYQRGRMYDFKIQKNGLITWCVMDGAGFPAYDQNFNFVRTYQTVNGYQPDGHELKVMADGSYFMIGFRNNEVDLSRYVQGGNPQSTVRETVVQEFTATGELIFQWRAWDNYDIRETGTDFPHINALDIDDDGQLLVSARHLSEITKVDRASGDIIWRLSGYHSNFSFPNDEFEGTSFQHAITALGHNQYLLFDNGNYHIPQVSRAVEYELDLTNMTATVVWQFRDTPDKYAYWLGNAQRLPTGNTLINFVRAQYPKVIEVGPDGTKHFELRLTPGADAYRAFRFPWHGVVAAPYLVLDQQPDNFTLVFNKFGDTNVAYYRIYGGTSPEPTALLSTSTSTVQQFTQLQKGTRYYFRVTAVSHQGLESDFSNEENATANFIKAGEELVANGDFSQGKSNWTWSVTGTASADWTVADGISSFVIHNGGGSPSSIQLAQDGLALIQDRKYVFQFDAWSDAPWYIQAQIVHQGSALRVYSPSAASYVSPEKTHFKYVFTMQQPSDFDASVVFNLGAYAADVYLQNVSLFIAPDSDVNLDGRVDFYDLKAWSQDWLKRGSKMGSDLNHDGQVDFSDFGVLGRNWSVRAPASQQTL